MGTRRTVAPSHCTIPELGGSSYARSPTPACSMVVNFIGRQSLLFDIIPHSVQPSSLYFNFYALDPSSHCISLHAHTTSTSFPGLYKIREFPYFRCPPIRSCLFLFIFITPHTHSSILISATSNLVSCTFVNSLVCAPYTSGGITTVMYTVMYTCPCSSCSLYCRQHSIH